MNTRTTLSRTCFTRLLAVFLFLASVQVATAQDGKPTTFTYGIELSGDLCGYADIVIATVQDENGSYLLIQQTTVIIVELLGSEVEQRSVATYHVDPETGQYTFISSHVNSGEVEYAAQATIDGNMAHCTFLMGDEEMAVEMPEGILLDNSVYLNRVRRDFVDGGATEMTYQALGLEQADRPIQTVRYTRTGSELVETPIGTFEAIMLESMNRDTGATMQIWMGIEDGMVLKVSQPGRMLAYVADASIKDRIRRANIDDTIISKTNVDITDVLGIEYMQVKVTMQPSGSWLSVEDLNVPGQRFEGTVVENRIEGVFTIEHPHYVGAGAPPYPPSFAHDESLQPFLEPSSLVESDDEVLITKARQLAEGSADSWEAAVRLGAWVAENIDYEIPGGIFSRKVYDMRAGECGGHSVLVAAFCRAVGIPARAVWGCMYTPISGGSFGQHAWTEIYMGESAGWIPVDSTAFERDYVDSGHIRLGHVGDADGGGAFGIALGAKTMEILDYRVGEYVADEKARDLAAGKYVEFAGDYATSLMPETFSVVVKKGRLTIEVAGQSLPMNDPDADGNWVCTLTSRVYCLFTRDDGGQVTGMDFHEVNRMRRKTEPDLEALGDAVPDDVKPYLGGYYLGAANAEFDVVWRDGQFMFHHPLQNTHYPLMPVVKGSPVFGSGIGTWTYGPPEREVTVTFLHDDAGSIISLNHDVTMPLVRK